MSQARAGGGARLLRLGLAAAAASAGAVALSVLLGGSAASAADDERRDQLGSVVDVVTQPVDAMVATVDSALAPVEAVTAPSANPVVAPVAPVAQAIVAAATPASGGLTGAVAALAPPVAAIVEPVLQPLADPLHDALDPVIDVADGAVDALPLMEDLLGEQPIAEALDSAGDALDAPLLVPASAVEDAALPGDALPAAAKSGVAPDGVDASAARSPAQWVIAAIEGGPSATSAVDLAPVDRDAQDTGAPTAPALPACANGTAGGTSPPPAIDHDHLLPAPAGCEAGAIEHDRTHAAPVEELTARPD